MPLLNAGKKKSRVNRQAQLMNKSLVLGKKKKKRMDERLQWKTTVLKRTDCKAKHMGVTVLMEAIQMLHTFRVGRLNRSVPRVLKDQDLQ